MILNYKKGEDYVYRRIYIPEDWIKERDRILYIYQIKSVGFGIWDSNKSNPTDYQTFL